MPETPEQLARQQIDAMLIAAGWVIQDYKALNLGAGVGVAVREVPLKTGPCDYLLLVDRKPVGIIEAKKKGMTLSVVADQSARYASSLPDFLASVAPSKLPFLYESTGVETYFRDERDPDPRSRRVFSFHRPETLADSLAHNPTLRGRLKALPPLSKVGSSVTLGMRSCQVEAITNLEASLSDAHPRALIQMATGAGKTYTACAFTYRLIRHAGAKRVLFLVDRSNLGRQAKGEFDQFVTPDTGRKFTELYNVQHLTSNKLDDVSRVTICTIQRLYSMLRGEELDEDLDEKSGFEIAAALSTDLRSSRREEAQINPAGNQSLVTSSATKSLDVAYNPAIPIEAFDFIVTDECHRSIYGLWRQVLEYFDAFLIGLTATPSKQTIGFFNQNLVTEYNHERAVADGVNVGYEVYRIKTQVTEAGGKVEKGFYVDKRNKLDRSKRWEQLDEDLAYAANELDRSVVVPSQIRTVLQAFKDALFTELFPGRTLVPKTLIFCKDDSHAEDVVHICREVFGKGNDFCKKITYQATKWQKWQRRPASEPEAEWQRRPASESKTNSGETPLPPLPPLPPQKAEELIQQFRTSPQLRIAVTVDMIATGTDIKPLECLLFLRDVRSRVYFEQMKGRGTRVLTPTDLQAVSGEDARAKTHFVIVDAVGVCESDKTDSRPLERKPTVALPQLLLGVALGKRDEDTLTTLAGRLARLDREFSPAQKKEVQQLSGKTLSEMSATLLRAVDPDNVAAASRRLLLERLNDPKAPDDFTPPPIGYFDPEAPVAHLSGDLPHWRQTGVTYFVTFRLADSLPQEKLARWKAEMAEWLQAHPEPHDEDTRREFYDRFPARIQKWLDAGYGSCVLDIEPVQRLVENALRHFHGSRYSLDEFVVAKNHVHVLVTPLAEHRLSEILHSWKSYTAHEILKVEAASRRLAAAQGEPMPVSYSGSGVPPLTQQKKQRRDASATSSSTLTVWQKESFDHIVRSPASLDKFRQYIRAHRPESDCGLFLSEDLRRDAAATLINEACAPFDLPALRDTLVKLKHQNEQTIDTVTQDTVVSQGFDAAAKEKAMALLSSFRDYIEQHKAEITALQLLYSRPYQQRLTEKMLRELEKKLCDHHAAWTEDNLWYSFAVTAPGKVKGRSQAGRFADLVALVRFALEQPVLEPFAESVKKRFNEWLSSRGVSPLNLQEDQRRDASATFTPEQLSWLYLIRDHIATSLSIDPEDFEFAPFNQRGGLGKAHQLFGEQLPTLLDELNEVLAA